MAEQGLLQARQILAVERSPMEQRAADIAGKKQVLKERLTAMDEALQVARGQIDDLISRLEQSQALTNKRDAEIDALHLKLSDLEMQRVADQRRSEEVIKHHAEERRQLEERATITERCLMTELDRKRQETKRLKLNLQQAAQQAETVGNQVQAEKQALLQKQLDAQSELRSARQALVLANERAAELRGLLDVQRTANGVAIAQLSQLLTEATQKAPVIGKSRKRVNSNASNPRNP